MKIFDKISINNNSKTYLYVIICTISGLFIVCAVIFLYILATKLNIIMNTPASETFTYFISIMDRIIVILTIFAVLPLTFYQLFSKNKNNTDIVISFLAVIILFVMTIAFIGGECYYFKKYKSGEFQNAPIFNSPTIEMKIFDKF